MKRMITAVSFAVLAVPAVAAGTGAPFEQTELDRVLPKLEITVATPAPIDVASLPFKQTQFDRGLPPHGRESVRWAAVGGNTVSDASIATDAKTGGSWASDHNFIAPAQ